MTTTPTSNVQSFEYFVHVLDLVCRTSACMIYALCVCVCAHMRNELSELKTTIEKGWGDIIYYRKFIVFGAFGICFRFAWCFVICSCCCKYAHHTFIRQSELVSHKFKKKFARKYTLIFSVYLRSKKNGKIFILWWSQQDLLHSFNRISKEKNMIFHGKYCENRRISLWYFQRNF